MIEILHSIDRLRYLIHSGYPSGNALWASRRLQIQLYEAAKAAVPY